MHHLIFLRLYAACLQALLQYVLAGPIDVASVNWTRQKPQRPTSHFERQLRVLPAALVTESLRVAGDS